MPERCNCRHCTCTCDYCQTGWFALPRYVFLYMLRMRGCSHSYISDEVPTGTAHCALCGTESPDGVIYEVIRG